MSLKSKSVADSSAFKKKFRDASPGRFKNQVFWRGVQHGIDAVQGLARDLIGTSGRCQLPSSDKSENGYSTHNEIKPAYIFDSHASVLSRHQLNA